MMDPEASVSAGSFCSTTLAAKYFKPIECRAGADSGARIVRQFPARCRRSRADLAAARTRAPWPVNRAPTRSMTPFRRFVSAIPGAPRPRYTSDKTQFDLPSKRQPRPGRGLAGAGPSPRARKARAFERSRRHRPVSVSAPCGARMSFLQARGQALPSSMKKTVRKAALGRTTRRNVVTESPSRRLLARGGRPARADRRQPRLPPASKSCGGKDSQRARVLPFERKWARTNLAFEHPRGAGARGSSEGGGRVK